MRSVATIFLGLVGLLGFAMVAPVAAQPAPIRPAPTQLELSAGLTPDEYGKYTAMQLWLIKRAMDNDRITTTQRDDRIARLKAREPYFTLKFGRD